MDYLSKHYTINALVISIIVFSFSIVIASTAPKNFPTGQFTFKVSSGSSISKVAKDLHTRHIIKSENLFKISVVVLSLNKGIKIGDYKFLDKENVVAIAQRMVAGDQRQPKVRITIPEGMNVEDMAFVFLKSLDGFNAPHFVAIAKKEEGYLYPDTYNFLANTKPEEIVIAMKTNFNKKISSITPEIKAFSKPLKDIITMASIIEKEANGTEDRKIIAGVLWKRISEGMLLQVDPPFYYILNKTGNVTYDDLKIDSPYNTYKYKGLPKGPIGSPSLDAIRATVNPVSTKYYFYLSGNDGTMHYATTYDGHLSNKSKYLDN